MPATATPRQPSDIDRELTGGSAESDFWRRVEQWKKKVDEFARVYERLLEVRPLVTASADPDLAQAYETQVARGSTIQSTIEAVQSTIDSVRAKLAQARDAFDGHLGIAPIIFLGAVGLITGGIATIGYWLSSSYDLMKRLEAEGERQSTYDRLRSQGLTHVQAVEVIESARVEEPGGWIDQLGSVAVLAIAGLVIWWLTSSGRAS